MVHNAYQLLRENGEAAGLRWLLTFEDCTHDEAVEEFTRMFCSDGYTVPQKSENGTHIVGNGDAGEFVVVTEEKLPDEQGESDD